MLKMISCDIFNPKFKTINFKKGLNIVEGIETNNEYNSIGKTTLLLIIDFVYGGSDYLSCVKKFPEAKQDHIINFIIHINNTDYYFSRSTTLPNSVNICDANFNVKEIIPLNSYLTQLKDLYSLYNYKLTFRDFTNRVSRIAGKGTLEPLYPIQAVNKEPLADGIISILKLFYYYEDLEKLKNEKDQLIKKETNLNFSNKHGWLKIPSKKEYESIKAEKVDLQIQLDKLYASNKHGKENIESLYAARLYELNNQIAKFEDEHRRLTNLIRDRKDYKSFSASFKNDMKLISHFFNQESVKRIEEIETFHIKLASTLSNEFEKENEKIKNNILIIENQINDLQKEVAKIEVPPTIPEHFMNETAKIQIRLNEINILIENYIRKTTTTLNKEKLAKELESHLSQVFSELNKKINDEIIKTNKLLTNKTAPIFDLIDEKHYTYSIANDGSTGSGNRGLICFDLALLRLTNLPYIVHDYDLIEPIETAVKQKLINLYTSYETKQIFIVLKNDNLYNSETNTVISNNKVITLSSNGSELFGEAWNKE